MKGCSDSTQLDTEVDPGQGHTVTPPSSKPRMSPRLWTVAAGSSGSTHSVYAERETRVGADQSRLFEHADVLRQAKLAEPLVGPRRWLLQASGENLLRSSTNKTDHYRLPVRAHIEANTIRTMDWIHPALVHSLPSELCDWRSAAFSHLLGGGTGVYFDPFESSWFRKSGVPGWEWPRLCRLRDLDDTRIDGFAGQSRKLRQTVYLARRRTRRKYEW